VEPGDFGQYLLFPDIINHQALSRIKQQTGPGRIQQGQVESRRNRLRDRFGQSRPQPPFLQTAPCRNRPDMLPVWQQGGAENIRTLQKSGGIRNVHFPDLYIC